MKTKFHLMGVGGSGAKSLSAFVHCAAAGLAPPEVTVSLLDQDAANGNLSETTGLIATYRRLHRDLGTKLEKVEGLPPPFACDIQNPANGIAADAPKVWVPLSANAKTMSDHFLYPKLRPELKQLMRALLNQNEEIDLLLERGFRGRPAVGAVVISSLTEEHPLHRYLTALANESRTGQRLFLMGSVFGGMGASGVPTVARRLRQLRYGGDGVPASSGERADSFAIGAGALLPYFEFPEPKAGMADPTDVAVRPVDIPWASRLALEYYYSHAFGNGESEVFDHLYLVGQQPLTSVGYFSTGSSGQRNPALLPELLTALSGCHFFASENIYRGQVWRASHREKHIGWEDLPRVWTSEGAHEVRCGLARLLRFAFAYRHAYFPCIYKEEADKYKSFDWFRKLIGNNGLSNEEQDTALELNRYCSLLLRWLADIYFSYQKIGPATDTTLDFCKVDGFARPDSGSVGGDSDADVNRIVLTGDEERNHAKRDREPVKLKLSEMLALQGAFDELIGGGAKDERMLDLNRIYDTLERSKVPRQPGLPAFVDALWRACGVLPSKQTPRPPRWWL